MKPSYIPRSELPLVSVVVTTKNEERCIRNCLGSIRSQTYPSDKIELIVVDNYWEAAGVVAAMRAGIAPASVRRPLSPAPRISR